MIQRILNWLHSVLPGRDAREDDRVKYEIRREARSEAESRFQRSLDDLNIAISMLTDPEEREYQNDHRESK